MKGGDGVAKRGKTKCKGYASGGKVSSRLREAENEAQRYKQYTKTGEGGKKRYSKTRANEIAAESKGSKKKTVAKKSAGKKGYIGGLMDKREKKAGLKCGGRARKHK